MVKLNNRKYYTLRGLKRLYAADSITVDTSYIVLSSADWDNDIVLYIEGRIRDGLRYLYRVRVAN
jgi:hypothetical protein